MKAPIWLPLKSETVEALENGNKKVALLCRIKRYKNQQLGLGYDVGTSMPIVDRYFTMVIDPFIDPDSGLIDAASDGEIDGEGSVLLSESNLQTGGNSNIVSADSKNIGIYVKDWFTRLDEKGVTVTVKEFDGNLVIDNNCSDKGGS